MPNAIQSVYDNIIRDLAHKLAFGPHEHQVRFEILTVKMAKQRDKNALRATSS